jgi:signal transduction histidine kinase
LPTAYRVSAARQAAARYLAAPGRNAVQLGRLAGSASRGGGRAGRWITGLSWPYHPRLLDAAWAVFTAVNLLAIVAFPGWETVPFHFIWISFTLLYGFRAWPTRPTIAVLALVMVTTATTIGLNVYRGQALPAQLTTVPLMAAMFVAIVWHARRKLAAENRSRLVSEENARLLATQRRFLQDASHQLRTPITIALGHAELLAGGIAGRQESDDIQVVLGELNRLRRIAERLLVIAAAEDPEFLHPEPVALDSFTMEILRRWRPTADRSWQLGRLDKATIQADRERLGLAVDALLENAVRHTATGGVIKMSVMKTGAGARMIVADAGQGIPAESLQRIFDRFRSGDSGPPRGTGLGLALVRAVARAHGGDIIVRSRPNQGSEFELVLPAPSPPAAVASEMAPSAADAATGKLARKP